MHDFVNVMNIVNQSVGFAVLTNHDDNRERFLVVQNLKIAESSVFIFSKLFD